MANLLATKPLNVLMAEAHESGEHSLKRALGALNLIMLGIGAIIVLSYILAGVACAFAGLCYAEFAALIPIAGSAYTYGYATLGEIFAWIIGWDLVLEYMVAGILVSIGWSAYFVNMLAQIGVTLPPSLTAGPFADPPG